ncbi:hypothetical protein MVEN_00362400 [Mycena venus]|uniref:Uncharacterized protein n=1 Tax=Mycena venus TaxID=2733690 RepID=A0A8H6YTI9_9AGAR|nr:hypothetical protein MVEN_00362400 [Mycena venus]
MMASSRSAKATQPSSLSLGQFPDSLRWCDLRQLPYFLPIYTPPLPYYLLGSFGTYASFVAFMSNLHALRRLTLHLIDWNDSVEPPLIIPSLELEALSLGWVNGLPTEDIILPLRTSSLTLTSYWPQLSPDWPRCISRYLHHLGDHLQYLRLKWVPEEHPNRVLRLDFSHSTALKHLHVNRAVRFDILATSSNIDVAPGLERLLAIVTAHCRLETIILGVTTGIHVHPIPWTPFAQFAALIDTWQFATVREIQFVVYDSASRSQGSAPCAREHFESLLSTFLPTRPTRRIVCIDGDPYE